MTAECRTCMSSDKPLRSLFEVDSDLIEFHIKLYTCFPTFNFDDSDFPKTMCEVCIKMLRNAYKFRELCIKSTSAFLKKRKDKNIKAVTKMGSIKPSTENEHIIPNFSKSINNNPNISDPIHITPTPNKLNIPDTTEPHSSIIPTKKLSENEVNITPQSISADLASKDIIEDTATNETTNVANDKNNANKKYIKVYPLNSVQNINSLESENIAKEKEITDGNSNKEKHKTNNINSNLNENNEEISVQPPSVLNMNITQNNDNENLLTSQDSNSLDIVVKQKYLIQNQEERQNIYNTEEEIDLVYRIKLVDGDESSKNNLNRTEITNEKTDNESNQLLNVFNKNILTSTKNDSLSKNKNNISFKDTTETINAVSNETSLRKYEGQIDTNHSICPISVDDLNKRIEEDLNRECLENNTVTTDISTNNLDFTEEYDQYEYESSLLVPLENYELNNFIKSSMYNEENIEETENELRNAYIEEQIEFQDEIIVMSNLAESLEESISNEIELNTNLLEENVRIPEIKIQNIKSFTDQCLRENVNTKKVESFEHPELMKYLVNDKPVSLITPVPIAKLLSDTSIENNTFQADEVDDLVNKNVTEVYDFSNHNDHNYAKKLYIDEPHTSHLVDTKKRKRKITSKMKVSKDLNLGPPPSKIEPIIIKKKQINVRPSSPNNSGKKRTRRKTSNKSTKILAKTSSSSNLLEKPDVAVPKPDTVSNLVEMPDVAIPKADTSPNLVQNVSSTKTNSPPNSVENPNMSLTKMDSSSNLIENPDVSPTKTNSSLNLIENPDVSPTKTNSSSNLTENPNVSPESIAVNTMVRRSYGTRASTASESTKINYSPPSKRNIQWKVKKMKSKKNTLEPIKLKIKNIAVKAKIPPKEYKKITRASKKTSKNTISSSKTKTETVESKPIRKQSSDAEEPPTKKAKIESNKDNEENKETPSSPSKNLTPEDEVRNDAHLEYPYGCDLCVVRMKSLSELEAHLATHSNQVVDTRITCKYCERSFANMAGYKMHNTRIHHNQPNLKTELNSHLCVVCKKKFPSKSSLHNHKKIHNF